MTGSRQTRFTVLPQRARQAGGFIKSRVRFSREPRSSSRWSASRSRPCTTFPRGRTPRRRSVVRMARVNHVQFVVVGEESEVGTKNKRESWTDVKCADVAFYASTRIACTILPCTQIAAQPRLGCSDFMNEILAVSATCQ